jgi:hypothetical protein
VGHPVYVSWDEMRRLGLEEESREDRVRTFALSGNPKNATRPSHSRGSEGGFECNVLLTSVGGFFEALGEVVQGVLAHTLLVRH